MSYVVLSQILPRCDHTTSTNYGAVFEMYMAAITILRCCIKRIDAVVTMNDTRYAPWDDLVLKCQGATYCFQLKHTHAVKKNKLKKCLAKRGEVVLRRQGLENVTFVYFTTASACLRLPRLSQVPDVFDCFLTNDCVQFDSDANTYFCTEQHDIALAYCDIYDALQAFIGEDYASKDFLRTLQVDFKQYVRNRFYRLVKPASTLTTVEVTQYLSYALLSQFMIPYAYSRNDHVLSKDLEDKLKQERIVVLNHRAKSSIKANIWKYIIKLPRGKHHLCSEWSFGDTLHMPLWSPNEKTDKRILRALALMDFKCRVVILRPRPFRKESITGGILSGLTSTGCLTFDCCEILKYVEVRLGSLDPSNLHDDLFCKLAVNFNNGLQRVLEAHDEVGYVNDEVIVDGVSLTPLIAAVKTAGVDIAIVEDLVKRGADLDPAVSGGYTALSFAVESNRCEIVELLLRHGAQPDPVDRYGNSPLFMACTENQSSIVELLLKYGSNRYAADSSGTTPIFRAYQAGNYKALRLLLQGHKHPTAANAHGHHILHQAALDGNIECLQCILQCFPEATPFMTGNAAGKTPLDIARENSHRDFVEILSKTLGNEHYF